MIISLSIFNFHALNDQSSVISFRPDIFKHDMAKLYEDWYETMSLS
jgi:hypothetical protein